MEKHGFISVVAILLFVPAICGARTIIVPDDFSSIQAAIDDANDYDEIEVRPGTYNEAINFNDKAIRLYSSSGPSVTTIDATGLNSSVVTCNSGEDANTTLEGFTITGGNATNGGGMYNTNSSPTVTDCNFTGNSAIQGGGMLNANGSSPNVTGCTFISNTCTDIGGGMYNYQCSPTVTDCNFSDNEAVNGGGGGMVNNQDSSPTLTNCTFTGNSANYGGGIYNNDNSNPIVTNCTFTANNMATVYGGAMHNAGSSPTVTDCTFSGNQGGGMYNTGSSPTVTNCTFTGNWAYNGGGMWNHEYGSPTVTNCTFTGNSADIGGGMNNYTNSSPTVTNCTFTGNSAAWDGGGMCNQFSSSPTVTNCILWGDTPDEIYDNASSTTVSYSDVEGGWGGAGGNNIDADPNFVDVDANDFRLLSESPCVDTGNTSAVPADTTDLDGDGDTSEPIPFDLNGDPRVWNVIVDMGALEYGELHVHNVTQGASYVGIQRAINDANNGDQIEVDPGTYKEETIDFKGKAIRLYSTAGPNDTTIDGTGNYHVVQCISGEGPDTILEGFTITGGNANGTVPDDRGGGMYCKSSSPTVANCKFSNNTASSGGGMYNTSSSSPTVTDCNFSDNSAASGAGMQNENNSSPTVINCTFSGNSASNGYGGGMNNYNNSTPTVSNCTFSLNTATINGGGVCNSTSSSPKMTNCTFTDNTASGNGGGMYNYNSSPTVTNCTFTGNTASSGTYGGGGMFNHTSSNPIVTNCTFTGNTATTSGGGMFNYNSSPTVTNCIFSGNEAGIYGGGMYSSQSSPTVVNCNFSQNTVGTNGGGIYNTRSNTTIINCTISVNTAAGNGGGMFNDNCIPTVTNCNFSGNSSGGFGGAMRNWISSPKVTNCTFTNNTAFMDGGGIFNANNSNPNLTNCILWGDSPDEIDNSASIPNVTYCDIQGGYFGTGNINVNPRFVDPWHGDYRPRAPECVDAGNNAVVPTGVTTDIRGKPRFVDDPNISDTGSGTPPIVDMGAYERQPEDIFKTITVDDDGPADFDTVQAAIDDARHGDEIEVAPGIYYEAINLKGKAVWLYSIAGPAVTTINGRGAHHVVQCVTDEGPYTVLDGFTITGGSATGTEPNDRGGGMYNYEASPTVTNCIFTNNTADANGGGMCNDSNSSPTVTNCAFLVNVARNGGGIANYGASNPMVTNCTFSSNSAQLLGGGMYSYEEEYGSKTCIPTVTNCIFWGNTAGYYWETQISGWRTIVTYSNVQGRGDRMFYNISADPMFALSGEPHLRFGSPCIDAGTNTPVGGLLPADPDSNPRKLDGDGDSTATVDMGAFEFNPEPQSPCMVIWPPVFEFIAHGGQAPVPSMLEILNIGSGTLKWSIEADCSWLELNRTGGQSSGEIDNVVLDPNISDLSPGKYHCTLTITDPNAINSPQVIWVTLSVGCVRQVPTTEYPTIRSAIEDSNDGDIILIADGTYYEYDLDFGGRAIRVESENGPQSCIVDCNDLGRGFYFGSGETHDSILDGLTIQDGNTVTYDWLYGYGSGIAINGASPIIRNCDVNSCFTDTSYGGALYAKSSNAIISNCNFSNNSASSDGGGMHINGGSPVVSNCTFSNNKSGVLFGDSGGGGMYCDSSSSTVTDCAFINNSATSGRGGGMANLYGNPTVINCTFRENSTGWSGGGMYNSGDSPTVTYCEFINNTADYDGGGICNDGLRATITNCTFTNNVTTGGNGGGMINNYSNAKVTNCTFTSNTATNYGGGIYNYFGRATITNCTFTNNVATGGNGGGMYNLTSNPTLSNCILWDDTPDEIYNNQYSSPTVTYSCIQGGWTGIGNIGSKPEDDPLFVDAAGNNGLRLQVMSPCIDIGRNIAGIYCDVRGSVRPIDISAEGDNLINNNFDIGAYEYSRYYSGTEDGKVPAFRDVEMPSFCLVEEPAEIRWKNHPGFPDDDIRITDPKAYQVNLVLVSEDRTREITLNDEPITVPSTTPAPDIPYTHEYTFKAIHAGRWYMRIELSEDKNQYVESPRTFLIGLREPKLFEIGRQITPPADADLTIDPTIEEGREDYFFWSDYARKLYAIGPIAAVVEWTDTRGDPLPVLVGNVWPYEMQIHVADSPAVELLPAGSQFSFVEVRYADNDAVVNGSQFSATSEGRCVLMYGDNANYEFVPQFKVVRTVLWNNPEYLEEDDWPIGTEVTEPRHNDDCGSGHVYREISPYDADIYDRDTRSGQIFAVNLDDPCSEADDLIVFWYQKGIYGADWPYLPKLYDPKWPSTPQEGLEKIVIASCLGSEVYGQNVLDSTHRNIQIYNQPDPALPGCNPNEEHATFFYSNQGYPYQAVYALRNDLNRTEWDDPNYNYTSEPYALLKYQDIYDIWHYRVFQVLLEEGEYVLRYAAEVGWLMQPPYPLVTLLPGCDNASYPDIPGPWWTDYNRKIWARHAGPSEIETVTGTIRWFYPLLEGFYYDFDQDGVQDNPVGTCVPWLDLHDSNSMPGVPIAVTYDVSWPSDVPQLQVGETLMKPKRGLPDITNQCSVEIIYDEPNDVYGIAGAVKLIEPLSEHRVELLSLPSQVKVSNKGGVEVFDDLPFHLRTRFYYDPLNHELVFKGYFDDTVVGEPILLLNVISDREREELRLLPGFDSIFQQKVEELYQLTQEALKQNQTRLIGGSKALSAGTASAEGFVTLVFADDEGCNPLPVSVEVIKVVCGPYRGELKVIESDNVFDERLTFRHSGDFGGRPEGRLFKWMYSESPDEPNDPNLGLLDDNWQVWTVDPCDGNAVLEITVGGPGLIAVQDLWFSCRYYDETCGEWSLWTDPQLHESWLKRVNRQVNLFDQRFKDFHESQINTLVSMIGQIGQRYEGDVALVADPENINSMGMLELYETLFRRASEFSIDQGYSDLVANRTLLFASSRLATLYTLLGNEAYADTLDPTIGFTTEGVDYGMMAPAIHCFQNQTDSLLSEELSLLRGLESDPYPQPLYNRLVWNFTSGDGEVAYASNYVITDMDDDGDIDEYDAKIMYPQGHGDAWGHYLMALKTYYRLLVHPDYTWVPQPEYVLVAGTPVEVDYFDERQFAKIAAAKAKTGAEIVDLTYRQRFDEDPENQWQGYKDIDSSRAWGVAGWASRAGQGAYFDWVVANALLPDVDTESNHTGLQKVDRTTVVEIRDIASSFNEVQARLDMADLGLNPLGIAKDAIPFDINPFELVDALGQPSGRTHFEQIYGRAFTALNNALTAFNFANQSTQLLRRQQDSLEDFIYNVEQREADFRSRRIEIFGYPYDDDIGPTGTYPEGYDGPDIYHYMYVDPSELMSASSPETIEFKVTFREPQVGPQGALSYDSRDVVFHLSPDGLGLIKPASWTGSRRAPGELQMARSELLQAKANFDRALLDYGNLLDQIEDQADILAAQYGLDTTELNILNKTHNTQESLNEAILAARGLELGFRAIGRRSVLIANALAEFLPKSVGFSTDVTAPGRGAIKLAGAVLNEIFTGLADVASIGELMAQQAKERVQSLSNIELTTARQEFAELQQLKQLEQLVRTEASQRLGLFTLAETMQQASGRYMAALARGERIYEELTRFRKQTAADIQHYRYKDMTFRVFRHDALQKYRAQFDLATRYTYLAAKAYDYETALLDDYTDAGQHFLNRIVRQRTIGQISQNVPIPGSGLAGVLAELNQNFDVFKTMMGFNNPQIETTWFSLRKENFRITQYAASNSDWQKELDKYYVDDLWGLPEFRRYCKPFDTEDVALPAIVIPFQTNITNGLNFFGWPGGADPFYAPENFVTKIRSVGIWFSNYDTTIMSPTPRVYLIPVGEDVVRADIGEIRSWQVVEQSIPLPFQIGEYELANNFEWIPMNDSVPSPLAEIRRYTRFRAYPDGGFNPTEMTYDSRLIGRSVWNTRWLLIIPGHSLYLSDPWEGMERFLFGAPIPGSDGERTGNGVTDIKLFFKTYAYPGY